MATTYQIKLLKEVIIMSQNRQFQAAKIQLVLVNTEHPKGVKRLFNNIRENATDTQITDLGKAIELLTTDKCTSADIITTDQLAID